MSPAIFYPYPGRVLSDIPSDRGFYLISDGLGYRITLHAVVLPGYLLPSWRATPPVEFNSGRFAAPPPPNFPIIHELAQFGHSRCVRFGVLSAFLAFEYLRTGHWKQRFHLAV